jgi:hypothetical protein
MLAVMAKADPVGIRDIAKRLGVARQTVKGWNLQGDLPPPKWHVSGAPAWDWPDIEKWARKNGKAGRLNTPAS